MRFAIHRSLIFRAELISYEEESKLSGVIYIHRISDNRFGGLAGRNFDMFRKLCGDAALRNVVLVTNMWGEVSRDAGETREKELFSNFFKLALFKGARMDRHHNTVQSAHDIIRRVMVNRPVVLRIQRELVDECKNVVSTAAGEAVNRELNEQIRRRRAELKEVLEEMEQAKKEKDEETREELEEETKRLRERMEEITKDSEGMTANYAAEKERMGARVKEMEREAKKGEWEEAERKRRLDDHIRRLQNSVPGVDRARFQQATRKPQDRLYDNSWITIPIYM